MLAPAVTYSDAVDHERRHLHRRPSRVERPRPRERVHVLRRDLRERREPLRPCVAAIQRPVAARTRGIPRGRPSARRPDGRPGRRSAATVARQSATTPAPVSKTIGVRNTVLSFVSHPLKMVRGPVAQTFRSACAPSGRRLRYERARRSRITNLATSRRAREPL